MTGCEIIELINKIGENISYPYVDISMAYLNGKSDRKKFIENMFAHGTGIMHFGIDFGSVSHPVLFMRNIEHGLIFHVEDNFTPSAERLAGALKRVADERKTWKIEDKMVIDIQKTVFIKGQAKKPNNTKFYDHYYNGPKFKGQRRK